MKILTILFIALLATSGRGMAPVSFGEASQAGGVALFELLGFDESDAPISMRVSTEYGMGRTITVHDADLIARVYSGLSEITVLEETDIRVTDSDTYVSFTMPDGSEKSVSFEQKYLSAGGKNFVIDGEESFWRAYYDVIDKTCEYYFDDESFYALRRYSWIDGEKAMTYNGAETRDMEAMLPAIDALLDITILGELEKPETEGNLLEFLMPDGSVMKFTLWENAVMYGDICYSASGIPALTALLNVQR